MLRQQGSCTVSCRPAFLFGRLRPTLWLQWLALAAVLCGCASPPAQPDRYQQVSPAAHVSWTAAIGRLDDDDDRSSCSATLVAPDVIATAAHCLFPEGREIDPTALTFYPNLGAAPLPVAQGQRILALGNDKVDPIQPEKLMTFTDWALVRITPPVTAVAPIAIGDFKVSEIDRRLAAGATLSQAGYGVYGLSAGHRLYQQINCRLVNDSDLPGAFADWVVVTNCRVIKGDSGGPMVLTDTDGKRYLVGIISGYRRAERTEERISFGAAAANFAGKIAVR